MTITTVHMRQVIHPAYTYCGLTDARNSETGELLRTLTTTVFDDAVTCEGCR